MTLDADKKRKNLVVNGIRTLKNIGAVLALAGIFLLTITVLVSGDIAAFVNGVVKLLIDFFLKNILQFVGLGVVGVILWVLLNRRQ